MAEPGRALVLVGRGRYSDPWHDDAAHGHRLAVLLADVGLVAEVRGTAAAALDTTEDLSLLVVVAGAGRRDDGWDGDDGTWAPFHAHLARLVLAGLPLLAVHQAANTFADADTWPALIGGRWVPGLSMHPPIGPAQFRAVAGVAHPVVESLGPVEAYDERYCFLQPDPGSTVLVTTEHQGVRHPVVWQSAGAPRVVYDGLGHDTRSYDSPSRRELLRREIRWLTTG